MADDNLFFGNGAEATDADAADGATETGGAACDDDDDDDACARGGDSGTVTNHPQQSFALPQPTTKMMMRMEEERPPEAVLATDRCPPQLDDCDCLMLMLHQQQSYHSHRCQHCCPHC